MRHVVCGYFFDDWLRRNGKKSGFIDLEKSLDLPGVK